MEKVQQHFACTSDILQILRFLWKTKKDRKIILRPVLMLSPNNIGDSRRKWQENGCGALSIGFGSENTN